MVKKLFDNEIKKMGPLYLFVNCAGMALCGTLENTTPSDIMVFIVLQNDNFVL